MHEQVSGGAIVGDGAEDGGVEGTAGDGGGCRIRDIECKSMDGGHRLDGGDDNLDITGERVLERVSMCMQMRPGLVDWARDAKVEARRGRWGPRCADGGQCAWEKGKVHWWGPGHINWDGDVNVGASAHVRKVGCVCGDVKVGASTHGRKAGCVCEGWCA